jgi:hypothetical protein
MSQKDKVKKGKIKEKDNPKDSEKYLWIKNILKYLKKEKTWDSNF